MDSTSAQANTTNRRRDVPFAKHGKSLNLCHIWHWKYYRIHLNIPKLQKCEQIKLFKINDVREDVYG